MNSFISFIQTFSRECELESNDAERGPPFASTEYLSSCNIESAGYSEDRNGTLRGSCKVNTHSCSNNEPEMRDTFFLDEAPGDRSVWLIFSIP